MTELESITTVEVSDRAFFARRMVEHATEDTQLVLSMEGKTYIGRVSVCRDLKTAQVDETRFVLQTDPGEYGCGPRYIQVPYTMVENIGQHEPR
jgi:hypothetical protein